MFKTIFITETRAKAESLFSSLTLPQMQDIISRMESTLANGMPSEGSALATPVSTVSATENIEPGTRTIFNEIPFRFIPEANNAILGSSTETDAPIRSVTIPASWMMETQVTQVMWKRIMGNNPSGFKGDNLPVERVSWNDVIDFARKVSLQVDDIADEVKEAIAGLDSVAYIRYVIANPEAGLFCLPDEHQWEFAARGQVNGSTTRFPWGDDVSYLGRHAKISRNRRINKTQPVGELSANGFGLYDMMGNVWEWTSSRYSSESFKTDAIYPAPTVFEKGNTYVLKGGSWQDDGDGGLSVAFRHDDIPTRRCFYVGFRLVRTIR